MRKIEPETWTHGTTENYQRGEGRGERGNGEKEGKGLVKEHV